MNTTQGFSVHEKIYSTEEIDELIRCIDKANQDNIYFRKSNDLYAVRRFIKELPQLIPLIFNQRLKELIQNEFGKSYFITKAIYFDKPPNSNWFVAYHQDLTISVDKKVNIPGFGPWTTKHNQFAVQPPISILENNFTIRIHLDDTNENNGALRIIPGSHLKGIYRADSIDWNMEREVTCSVPKGGIMIMRPLLLHASSKSINQSRRRVIHIEFSNQELPEGLQWPEKEVWEHDLALP